MVVSGRPSILLPPSWRLHQKCPKPRLKSVSDEPEPHTERHQPIPPGFPESGRSDGRSFCAGLFNNQRHGGSDTEPERLTRNGRTLALYTDRQIGTHYADEP